MPDLREGERIETDIPARLDRLPWSRWHARIIFALGTSWLLDGLEVTMVGSLSGILESKSGLGLTDPQVTGAATTYLAGAVVGALLFGYLTDRLGRRKLFLVTLATYSVATIASAFSWNLASFSLFRFFTGLGIGGEYAAINSAVDELIPGKVRGLSILWSTERFGWELRLEPSQQCSSSRDICRRTPAGATRLASEDRWAF
jgi:MFS family permease